MSQDISLFALDASREFGERVAQQLGLTLSPHEERMFEDGEHKARPLVNVRGRDVYVVQSLHGGPDASPNDKLCRLLFFIGALRDAGAARVTGVVPYLAYARKDRRTQPRDPITTRYVAQLIEAAGVDRVVTVDVHNLAAFENAFRRPTVHLEARPVFVSHLLPLLHGRQIAVVSPDAGGIKRAESLRASLADALGAEASLAFLEKRRSGGVVGGQEVVVGSIEGRTIVIVDDLISTGTLARAAAACGAQGAAAVYAAVTHGLFTGDAERVVTQAGFDRLIVTNTVPPFRLQPQTVQARLAVLDIAPLLAEAIRRLHREESLDGLDTFGLPQANVSTQTEPTSR
jgi:ribose-phosphate pyrophosphokinase